MEQVQQVVDLDIILDTSLEKFIGSCQALNPDLSALASQVKDAFLSLKALIVYGLANPQPEKDHQLMLQYTAAIRSIVDRKAAPPKELDNHFKTVKEVIVALSFMTVKPAPTQFIRDMIDCSQYYANRVLCDNKGCDKHQLFVSSYKELFNEVLLYVKKHFLTGFTWNSFKGSCAPPPPPPPPAFCDPVPSGGDEARMALLNQLNQGSDITRHLKPVQKGGAAVSHGASPVAAKSPASGKPAAAKVFPPKFQLEGRKWVVEHQKENYDLVINNESMSESVACYKCESSNLTVTNKCNNVVIDSCKRSGVSLGSVIACVELIRCERVSVKCDGVVPLINLENCESVQIFLPEAARGVEIVSAKCSSCNVCLLSADGSYVELPIQEQIKTVLVNDKLVSNVIEKN